MNPGIPSITKTRKHDDHSVQILISFHISLVVKHKETIYLKFFLDDVHVVILMSMTDHSDQHEI